MTVSVNANIHFNEDDVWHRWHPVDDNCHAYGALKFGEAATLYFDKPAMIDTVIAELVALKQEMDPPVITDSERTRDEPASPDAAEALIDAIVAGTPVVVTDEPEYPAVGSAIPPESNGGQSGYRVGECGHRVAGSEWQAGFRRCEHCGPDLGDDEREYCPECGADEDAGEEHADKCTIGDEATASVTT